MTSKDEQPIIIKTSITKEIYDGNSLKSRFELNQCRIIPSAHYNEGANFPHSKYGSPQICDPCSLPMEKKTSNDNLKKPQKKIMFMSKVKEQNIGISNKNEVKQNNFHRYINICSTIFISILLVKLISPYIYLHGEESFSTGKVQKELYARILNQNSAIATVIQSLENLNKPPPKKMITCLMGPTGVGKSYLINILSEQMSSEFIRIFHSSQLANLMAKQNYASNYLSQKVHSDFLIVVIDDLKPSDYNRLKRLIKIIFSIRDKNILVLAVFNVETEDCLGNSSDLNNAIFIREDFGNLSEHLHFAHFNPFNESVVRLWLEKALTDQKIKFEFHDEIINALLKGHNIKCHGLKGLQSKLLIELSEYDKTDK